MRLSHLLRHFKDLLAGSLDDGNHGKARHQREGRRGLSREGKLGKTCKRGVRHDDAYAGEQNGR